MLTHVEFRAPRFLTSDADDQALNPGVRGKALASFLYDALRSAGIETGEPYAEDWGWVVPVVNDEFELWVGCGYYAEYADGFLCFIEPHTPTIRRWLRKIQTRSRLEQLQRALDEVLAEGVGIHGKSWCTYEEFNKPRNANT